MCTIMYCPQVDMPVCYGALDRCSAYDQQCCYNQPQQVCRQVPQRFPVRRCAKNISLLYKKYFDASLMEALLIAVIF